MIATRKDILFFTELVVLSAIAVSYAFSQIPSPFEQQKVKWDHERVVDLGMLKSAIDQYYYTNAKLPETLEFVTTESYARESLRKADPQTDQPYTYRITSPTSYEICAVFTTTNQNLTSQNDYDYDNYEYQTYRDQFKHPQGNFCFSQKVQDQTYQYTYPTPSGTQVIFNQVGDNSLPIPTAIISPTTIPLPTITWPNPTTSIQ